MKITDIVITDGLGCYGNVAKHIVESLGMRCWILDENDKRRGESDFLNYESLRNLPNNFAIWSLSDRATRILSSVPQYSSKSIFTQISNLEEFLDKADYRANFPKVQGIHYPKCFELGVEEGTYILKERKGSGTTLENGRAKLINNVNEYRLFEYINHDREQVVLAYFEDGKLLDTVWYQGKVTEPWTMAKPNEYIVTEGQFNKIITWLEALGEKYNIDGIIDAEFMINKDNKLYFSESNPRQNGQSYFIAKPMIYRFLQRKIKQLEKNNDKC